MKEIFERVSVRRYTDQPIEPEKIEALLRAGMAAPSASNQQPWEFIVIEDRQEIVKLSSISQYASSTKTAAAAIVLLGNKELFKVDCMWEQDLSAATQNILLEAVHLGLGAVWLGVSPMEDRMRFISDLYSLPENILPFAVITLGYPDNPKKPGDRFKPERVHYGKY